MGELVRQTIDNIMLLAVEEIIQGKDPIDTLSVWADLAEEYGEL